MNKSLQSKMEMIMAIKATHEALVVMTQHTIDAVGGLKNKLEELSALFAFEQLAETLAGASSIDLEDGAKVLTAIDILEANLDTIIDQAKINKEAADDNVRVAKELIQELAMNHPIPTDDNTEE